MIEIKSWCCDTIICSGVSDRHALEVAARGGVSLRYADLRNLDLEYLNLANADFRNADLRGVDFSGTNLAGVNLKGAMVDGTCFEGANLGRANVIGVDLSLANMVNAVTDGMYANHEEMFRYIDGLIQVRVGE